MLSALTMMKIKSCNWQNFFWEGWHVNKLVSLSLWLLHTIHWRCTDQTFAYHVVFCKEITHYI